MPSFKWSSMERDAAEWCSYTTYQLGHANKSYLVSFTWGNSNLSIKFSSEWLMARNGADTIHLISVSLRKYWSRFKVSAVHILEVALNVKKSSYYMTSCDALWITYSLQHWSSQFALSSLEKYHSLWPILSICASWPSQKSPVLSVSPVSLSFILSVFVIMRPVLLQTRVLAGDTASTHDLILYLRDLLSCR